MHEFGLAQAPTSGLSLVRPCVTEIDLIGDCEDSEGAARLKIDLRAQNLRIGEAVKFG